MKRRRILVWGFYNQGNIGDDLMAIIFSEMLKDIGATPVIFSSNMRFKTMGYETISELEENKFDAILLGGGAFFKSATATTPKIEANVINLSKFINKTSLPIIGASLGSDGVSDIQQMTPARHSIVTAPSFHKAAVRLGADLNLKISGLELLPDVVLTTAHLRQRLSVARNSVLSSENICLINLSRRSLLNLPQVLWRMRKYKKYFILAHSGELPTGGEIAWPILPKITTDDIIASLDKIASSNLIVSSKLHPGVIALSLGSDYCAVNPRPKTKQFLDECLSGGLISSSPLSNSFNKFSLLVDNNWQAQLWSRYTDFLAKALDDVIC